MLLTHLVPLVDQPGLESAVLKGLSSFSAWSPKCHVKNKPLEQNLKCVADRKPWVFKGKLLHLCALTSA